MLRVFIALNIFLLSLLACNGSYKSCQIKTTNLHVVQDASLVIPLQNNQTLIYSKEPMNAKVIKHDPFLNLYLVESKKYVRYPFRINPQLSLAQASVGDGCVTEGKIKTKQIGLNALATYTKPIIAPSLLLNSCCNLEGLVTPKGIIQRDYLDHFVHSKNRYYGEIGVRVVDEDKLIIIKRVNPFDLSVKFKKNDCITHVNGKKILDASDFMKHVLFAKVGTQLKVIVVRNGKKILVKATIKQRFGGGAISDTFLEAKGLYFSSDLTLLSVGEKYKKFGLHIGDRLIQVNGKKVTKIEDIRMYIDDFKHFASLVFTRNDFQFFVNINP